MGWLDPADCLAARDALQRGCPLEAGGLLLKSPHRGHRAARQLLGEIAVQLVQQAETAYSHGELLVAGENINCAAECAELTPEAAALRLQINGGLAELQKQQQWQAQRLARARAWADQGRVRSAMGLLKPIADDGDAQRLGLDLDEQLARMDRYLGEARDLLVRGNLTAASQRLTMAQAIHAADSRVLQLQRELNAAMRAFSPDESPEPLRKPIVDRTTRFALGYHALVVSQDEITIGSGCHRTPSLPMFARIHSCHARVIRDHGRYRLANCQPSYRTLVQNKLIQDEVPLADGDLIAFLPDKHGSDRGIVQPDELHCQWRFSIPAIGSTTAVLRREKPGGCMVHTPVGEFGQVVLLDDHLEICPGPPAHLVLTRLPCKRLTLSWRPKGLVIGATNGMIEVAEATPSDGEDSVILEIPSHITISPEHGSPEQFCERVFSPESWEELVVKVYDPFHQTEKLA